MAKKKVTSSQVAERAGVSQATVSMILNRRDNVSFSAETVEKVERAARELGYELPKRRKQKENRKEKLIVVPREVDLEVSERKLRFLGIAIDHLTPEQEAYLNSSGIDHRD